MSNFSSPSLRGLLTLVLIFAAPLKMWAQKQITCPNGEKRIPIDVEQLALAYEGKSFETTLSALKGLTGTLAVNPKLLQQAAEATQQWNELLKGLAIGWNSCVISQQQYDDGLKRIYPRLREDAAELEQFRQGLLKGQHADAQRFQRTLTRYLGNLRRFAEASNTILESLHSLHEEEAQNQQKLDEILARLPKPADVHREVEQELQQRKEEAENEYNQGYDLLRKYQSSQAAFHFRKALGAVPLPVFYRALSTALLRSFDLEEAERVVREGLQLHNLKVEEEASLNQLLGVILKEQGNLAGALEYSQRALEIDEKFYGPEHPDVAADANNIALILMNLGDLPGALKYSKRALKIDEKVYGFDHPNVARDATNISLILMNQGDLAGALEYSKRALKIDEKVGPDNPDVATDATNIALILKAQGHLEEALEYSKRALKIDEKVYGLDHPNVAIIANNIAQILAAQGDLPGALESSRRALEIAEKFYGPDHPKTKIIRANLQTLQQLVEHQKSQK